jgi:hypothetical protein
MRADRVSSLVLDGILQGILFCQAATWFRKSYPKERWILRTLAVSATLGRCI